MVRVGEGIPVTASARPSARTSRVQVRFWLHLGLSWQASRGGGVLAVYVVLY